MGDPDPLSRAGRSLIGHILGYLDARSVARCACINTTWRSAADDDFLWAGHCQQLWSGGRLAYVPPAIRSLPVHKEAYVRSLADAARTDITKTELCRYSWRFIFKRFVGMLVVEERDSPYTAILQNYW